MTIAIPADSAMHSEAFTFGVATASFQIEGGVDQRLTNIWDSFCATQGKIADNSNGDVACDHINLWQQDVDLICSLGVDAYRLSISWPRVIKEDGTVNPSGLDFYLQLLDRLNQRGIKVFVTFYHWDLPQYLEDQGGWLNRQTAYRFRDYVSLISQAFGERVYSYATLNEPFCSAYLGYEIGVHAPGFKSKAYGIQAAHHLLLAHGLAMQVLAKTSPNTQNGIVLNCSPSYAHTNSAEDKAAAEYADDYFNHWYLRPLIEGVYPDIIDSLPDEQKPPVMEGDMAIINQPLDYLGINYYTRAVYQADSVEPFVEVKPAQYPLTEMGWEIYPQGFTDLLVSLNNKYTLPPMYITENGAAMDDKLVDGQVHDQDRVDYFNSHLNAVNDAMIQGVDIRGYFAWSLMDNFEWALGYQKRFGIVYVDYQTQQRTVKASGSAYRALMLQRNGS